MAWTDACSCSASSASLATGFRSNTTSLTVPVNASTGLAGFVFPGDRVDLVVTEDIKGTGDGDPLRVSETIVRNIRVLATDQRYTDKDEDGKTVI